MSSSSGGHDRLYKLVWHSIRGLSGCFLSGDAVLQGGVLVWMSFPQKHQPWRRDSWGGGAVERSVLLRSKTGLDCCSVNIFIITWLARIIWLCVGSSPGSDPASVSAEDRRRSSLSLSCHTNQEKLTKPCVCTQHHAGWTLLMCIFCTFAIGSLWLWTVTVHFHQLGKKNV